MTKKEFDTMMATLAQGCVNINEHQDTMDTQGPSGTISGCFIQDGSPVHEALMQICEKVAIGEIVRKKKKFRALLKVTVSAATDEEAKIAIGNMIADLDDYTGDYDDDAVDFDNLVTEVP